MMQHDGHARTEIGVLKRFRLLYWKTASICYESRWFSTDDLKEFAITCLESEIADSDHRVALLASDCHYQFPIDFLETVQSLSKAESIDEQTAERIWIFARLVATAESGREDSIKFEELQDIIMSARDYPEFLRDCDQYHISRTAPLDAMMTANEELKRELTCYCRT